MKVTSRDGTPIGVFHTGSGPPLILSTGSMSDHRRWAPVLPLLEKHLTVYTYDRRGRGDSGDNTEYALEREYEDLAAIVHSVGGPVSLLGHSFGGIVALESALLTNNLDKLVLYEPPIHMGPEAHPPGVADRIQKLIDAGDREGAIMKFYIEIQKRTPEELERVKGSPLWPMFITTVHTLPREMRHVEAYRFDRRRFQDLDVSTLLLLGSKSPAPFHKATNTINDTLPNCRIRVMPDQGHAAIDTGTELFASEIIKFLTE